MSLSAKRVTAAGAGLLRKAIPGRGWRRFTTVGIVVALVAFGTVTAVTALPAQANPQSAQVAASSHDDLCTPPPSPTLAGFTQGYVSVPGDSIHYVTGGSGPVLVLLHGWPLTWWEFNTIMPTLAKSYTVVAFDLPGLGNSAIPTGTGYTDADIATLIHDAVVALGYGSDNISILGHDMGGNVAYAYARLYSSSVNRIMVIETALNGYGLENLYTVSFHFLFNQQPTSVTSGIINNVASSDAYLNYLYSFSANSAAITAQDKAIWYGDYACPATREAGYDYYRAYPQDATWDTTTNTSQLTVPIAAVGGQDSFGGLVAQSFGNADSDVQSIIAPGSGHYVPLEDSTFLAECATLYFSSSPPSTAPAGYSSCLPS